MIVYAEVGESFFNAVKRVQCEMYPSKYITLRFNGIDVTIGKDSAIDDVCTIYSLKQELRRLKGDYV